MPMRHHIDRRAIDIDIDICAVVAVEAPEEDLFCFAPACMLRGDESGHNPQNILRRITRQKL